MNELDEVERILEDISRKAPPSGLKQRILFAARRREKQTLFLNPAFRTAAALSFILLALAFFSDIWVTRSQTRHLSALLEPTSLTEPSQEAEFRELLAELEAEDLGRALSEWMLRRYKIQERPARSGNISKILSRILEEFDENQD